MKAIKSMSFRGSTRRADAIDESASNWKAKAGREAGPDTYVPGDYVASVLSSVASMNARERNSLYGGSVLLLGLVEGTDLLACDSNGSSDPYVTIVLVDHDGKEIDEDKTISRTISTTLSPQWDELIPLGLKANLADAAFLRLKLKDYDTPLHSDNMGELNIPLADMMGESDGTAQDGWYEVQPRADMKQEEGQLGRLHLQFLYHGPPPDPQPLSIGIRAVSGRTLLAADMTGFSDPYIVIKPVTRSGHSVTDAKGKAASMKTSIIKQTLDPIWNEAFIFGDLALGEPGAAGTSEWGWEGGQDATLAKAHTTHASVHLERATALHFDLFDSDFGKIDDVLGQVHVPFSAIFGDEDCVMSGSQLRLDKWWKVSPCKGMDAKKMEGKLGSVRLDIVLRFDAPLIPEPWVEAVDAVSGTSYYWHTGRSKAQWEEPAAYRNPDSVDEVDDGAEEDAAAPVDREEGEGWAPPGHLPGDKAHKPPKPANPAPARASVVSTPVSTRPAHVTVSAPAATPAPVPTLTPVPAVQRKAKVAEEDGEEEEEEDSAPAAADAEAVDRAAGYGSSRKDTAIDGGVERPSDYSGAGLGQSEREKAFFDTMRKNSEAKKKAEEEARRAKVASMTPEELAAWEAEQAAEERRINRKDRMLSSQLTAFGSSKATSALRGGRAGRGRGRGGKA